MTMLFYCNEALEVVVWTVIEYGLWQGRSVKLFWGGAKLTDFVTEYFEKKDKYNFTF